MDTNDEKSENAFVTYLSDINLADCESLIGKTVKRIDASEYSFKITFTDDTTVRCTGNRWGGCSLGVEIDDPSKPLEPRRDIRREEFEAQIRSAQQPPTSCETFPHTD